MTVEELIEELRKMPKDLVVLIDDGYLGLQGCCAPVEHTVTSQEGASLEGYSGREDLRGKSVVVLNVG